MWSTVLLSTGLVLLIGCATSAAVLLRKQFRHGATGFGMLAASDSVLSTLVGTALVGLSLLKEESHESRSCSKNVTLISASTFLLSFVNSFISVLLMAIECWIEAGTGMQDKERRDNIQKIKRRGQLTIGMVTQWLLPVLSIVILYQLTPNNIVTIASGQGSSNNTCQLVEMFPVNVANECPLDTVSEEDNQNTNNLTLSVVQRIYELINGSVSRMNPSDTGSYDHPNQPQTKEEWKDVFMLFHKAESKEKHRRSGRETLSAVGDLISCDETCTLSYKKLEVYFVGVVLLVYIIPTLGTVLLHRQARVRSRLYKGRSIEEEQETSVHDEVESKVCNLKKIKMLIVSNFVMWTPTVVERLFRKWLCKTPPKWLQAILFIIGQINTIIRGLITANTDKPMKINVIVPLNSEVQSPEQVLPDHSSDKVETLFHKRVK